MTVAPFHPQEPSRLEALRRSGLLDSPPEADFDGITRLAAHICGVPIALVSLVDSDRQWFKSALGIDVRQTPREPSFCAHALLGGDLFEIPDASADPRFADNPLVTGDPGIRFYAGMPLRVDGEAPLGTLCVIDRVPRRLDESQRDALRTLGRQVGLLIRARCRDSEQRAALQGLARSEARHRTLGESAPIGIFQTDTVGRCLYVNSQWSRIFGISAEEAVGDGWSAGLHPEDREAIFREWERTAGQGREFRMTFRTIQKDGGVRTVRSHSQPLRIAGGELVGHVGCVEDITELERSRRHRDQFFRLALDPLCIASTDGRLLAVNPAWTRTLGWAEEELLSRPWSHWVHPDDLAATQSALGLLEPEGHAVRFENRFRCRDGSFRWFSWNVAVTPGEETLFAVVRDITQQREAEDREREANSRHRALFETASDSMLILEAEGVRAGVIVDANRAAAQHHGLLREEFVGRRYRDLFPELDRRLADSRLRSMAAGEPVASEVEHRRRDGSPLQLEETADRFLSNGRPHILVVGRDVSARKQAELALRRREADLRRAQKQARLGAWTWNRTSGSLEVTDETLRILRIGEGGDRPRCTNLSRHFSADSHFRLEESVRQAIRHGISFTLDLEIRRADGAAGFVSLFGEVERSPDGQVGGLVGTVQDITDRKLAENALRASEERWSFALEGAGDGVWDWDVRNGVVSFSRRWKEMLGYGDQEIGGRVEEWFDRIHPEDLPSVRHSLDDHLEGRSGIFVAEYRMRSRSGGWTWILARGMIMQRDGYGGALRMLGTQSDISQRKAIESAARRDALLLAESQAMAHVGGWEMDLDTEHLYWTDQTHRIFGTDPSLHIPTLQDTLERFSLESRERVEVEVNRAIEQGGTFDLVLDMVTDDGRQAQIQACGSVIRSTGRPVKLVGAFQDVTVRRQAELERIRLAALNHAVILGASHSIIATDIDGTITVFNPAAERLTGYSAGELVGQHTPERFHDPAEVAERAAGIGRDFKPGFEVFVAGTECGVGVGAEWTYVRKDGARVPVWLGISRLTGPDGVCIGYLGIASDLSERKRVEDDMRRAKEAAEEANRAKSEFLAMMSHEIRTPMNGVLGFLELLKGTELSEEQESYVSTIDSSGNALLSLINDILDLSKIEAGRMEVERVPFDLHKVVEETCRILSPRAESKGLSLEMTYAPEATHRLIGDPTRVRQVLLNLAGNAVKFTEKGRVAVTVARSDGLNLRVAVTDSGLGIPQERLDRLFKKFSQVDSSTGRRYGGTGLGLAISKQLVELMGGRIGVESRFGEGSTFWFDLPMVRPAARKATPPARATSPSPTSA